MKGKFSENFVLPKNIKNYYPTTTTTISTKTSTSSKRIAVCGQPSYLKKMT